MKELLFRHLTPLRRTAQLLTLAAMFLLPWANRQGFSAVIGTFYSMEVLGLPIMDPALGLQTLLLTHLIYIPLLTALILPVVAALIFGKLFCGWVCPYNFLSECAMGLRRRLWPQRPAAFNPAKGFHWAIPALTFLLILLLGVPLITWLSMPGILTSQAADLVFLGSIGVLPILVVLILAAEMITGKRFWCKYGCPVGGVLSLFRAAPTLKVVFEATKCTCARAEHYDCQKACPLALDPRKKGLYPYCYNCGACVSACQKNGRALSLAFMGAKSARHHQRKHNLENNNG